MLGGGAIRWFSRAQRITATATSESEYVALAEIVNELRFLRQVKAFMLPPIDYNIRVRVVQRLGVGGDVTILSPSWEGTERK